VALILFDLDDTLADRRSIFETWAKSLLDEIGQDPNQVSWLIERDGDGLAPRDEFFAQVIEQFLLDESVESFAESYHRNYVQSFRCTDEVIAAVGWVRQAGFKTAVVTNGPTRSQSAKLAASGLSDVMDACCVSEAEGFWKPDAELFRIAAKRCNESLEGAWMIGDNPVADIGGAAALGLKTAWMRLGRTWPEDLGYRPTLEVDGVPEAVDVILKGSVM